MSQPQLRQPGVERSLNAPTLGRMLLDAGARTGVAIRFPRAGAWHEWTYADLAERARRLALGLVALGVRPGDRVAVLSQTRPEWTLVDGAILCAGAAVVPIYHTNSPGECEHVVSDSGARVVVCEDAAQLAKIDEIRDRCPDLEHVVTIDPAPGATTIDELAQRAADADAATLDEVQEQIAATDPATIVYTSGTTGPPKGCVLTHRNLLSTMAMYEQRLPDLGSGSVIFMFLPLAHVLARVVQMVSIDVGATLAFWSGVEAERKRPWRIARRLGPGVLLRYLLGRLPVDAAFEALSERAGCRVGWVALPSPRAAVDVDTAADWRLANRLLREDPEPGAAR